MEQIPESSPSNKWPGRLAIFFALLFAIFWSLDPAFFWVLLGLTVSFAILSLGASGIKFPTMNRPRAPGSPGPVYRGPAATASVTGDPVLMVRKVMRLVLVVAGSIVLFLFVVGIFADKDDTGTDTAVENTVSKDVDTNTFTEKGNASFNQGNYDSALFYYEKVLTVNSRDQYGLYNKALVFLMKQDYRKSIRIIRQCLRYYPDYNEAKWLLGDDYFSLSNYDSALLTLDEAYRNGYNDPGFVQLIGDVYLKKNDRVRAAEFYRKVIETDTTKVEVYRQLIDLDPANAEQYRKRVNALDGSAK